MGGFFLGAGGGVEDGAGGGRFFLFVGCHFYFGGRGLVALKGPGSWCFQFDFEGCIRLRGRKGRRGRRDAWDAGAGYIGC